MMMIVVVVVAIVGGSCRRQTCQFGRGRMGIQFALHLCLLLLRLLLLSPHGFVNNALIGHRFSFALPFLLALSLLVLLLLDPNRLGVLYGVRHVAVIAR